jgi:transcriptional regulator with XRE-family HTH domain
MDWDETRKVMADVRKTKRKITQKQLADLIPCHQSMVSDHEYGRHVPSLDSLITWVEALNVTVDVTIALGRTEYTVTDLKDGQSWT